MTATGGSIAIVSSAAARMGLVNHEAIGAAKSWVIGLTLSAATTYAPRGIRVNCVAPGLVRTPMTARLTANETLHKASTAMHALGRLGDPADVAGRSTGCSARTRAGSRGKFWESTAGSPAFGPADRREDR
jgi:NAD(P)-dependent dehydrogenase (short-subunit alcohol dehydrogenase family)